MYPKVHIYIYNYVLKGKHLCINISSKVNILIFSLIRVLLKMFDRQHLLVFFTASTVILIAYPKFLQVSAAIDKYFPSLEVLTFYPF